MTYLIENQQLEFNSQATVTAWVQNQLTNYWFLYWKAEGDDMNICQSINILYFLILFTKE